MNKNLFSVINVAGTEYITFTGYRGFHHSISIFMFEGTQLSFLASFVKTKQSSASCPIKLFVFNDKKEIDSASWWGFSTDDELKKFFDYLDQGLFFKGVSLVSYMDKK
jgi:hypothetical protein